MSTDGLDTAEGVFGCLLFKRVSASMQGSRRNGTKTGSDPSRHIKTQPGSPGHDLFWGAPLGLMRVIAMSRHSRDPGVDLDPPSGVPAFKFCLEALVDCSAIGDNLKILVMAA